ncbi:MAG: GGGtGRT protein [Hydrogeniiclostridium mannosilyticum]
MANDVKFEGKERRMAKIEKCLAEYGLASLEDARDLCLSKGIDVDKIVKGVQPIAFENASWAYTLGSAIALKKGAASAADAAEDRHRPAGFCIWAPFETVRSVYGNLGKCPARRDKMSVLPATNLAAAEGAIGIARTANRA